MERHPEYGELEPDWRLMRDAYAGERTVKSAGALYLPPTSSHLADGYGARANSPGQMAYDAYRKRARYYNFVREAVQAAVGMLHSQPYEIRLPEAMRDVRSSRNETMNDLLRRISTEQLVVGRIALLADLPKNGGDLPYVATYSAERLINWDDGSRIGLVPQVLNLAVLDESEQVRKEGLSWTHEERYRVLSLGSLDANEPSGDYRQTIVEKSDQLDSAPSIVPSWRGRTLRKIPLVVINSCDLVNDPDDPPMLDLANMCMTIYRGDADYRQNLFMQGQDTFVTIGANMDEQDSVKIGAGARLDLPPAGDAKYVGVQSSGLKEQREAQENLIMRAGSMGAQTLDTVSRERESGESLRVRVAARTADMNQIADTSAAGVEAILKICAEWMGENPDEVQVIPNKEFGESPLTGQSMVEIATARNLGWPISARSMHDLSVRRKITNRTFEEEMASARSDLNTVFAPKVSGDRAPEQPNEDD